MYSAWILHAQTLKSTLSAYQKKAIGLSFNSVQVPSWQLASNESAFIFYHTRYTTQNSMYIHKINKGSNFKLLDKLQTTGQAPLAKGIFPYCPDCPNSPKLQVHFGNLAEEPSVFFSVQQTISAFNLSYTFYIGPLLNGCLNVKNLQTQYILWPKLYLRDESKTFL